MIPIPPTILLRIAALPKAVVADVLSIFADLLASFEVPQNTQIKQVEHTQKTQVADFEVTQKTQKTQVEVFEAQNAPFCQVPPAPLPSSISREESREEGSKENKALPRKASTLTAARARDFEEFWAAYPKRINKQAALKRFELALKQVSFENLISAARAYARATQATEKQFIKAPDVWLNKGCYDDELPLSKEIAYPLVPAGELRVRVKLDTPQWEAWDKWWRKERGKAPPTHNGGWHFPSEWPPE